MRVHKKLFNNIVRPENLFSAWDEFKRDKRGKPDVLQFEKNLEQSIFQLHRDLKGKTYKHGPYIGFRICDPKLRHIHKAIVRDRVLHHAIFKILNPVFEPMFISTSFSCRVGRGTHKGVEYLIQALRVSSKNGTNPCYALKCDVQKFFDSIDHEILFGILKRKVIDPDILWLLEEVIGSYTAGFNERERERERERVKMRREKACRLATLPASFSPIST
jgi:retron-type reverse transcriptase